MDASTKQTLMATAGGLLIVAKPLWTAWKSRKSVELPLDEGSGQAPTAFTDAFVQRLNQIAEAAPRANEEVWWQYALEGLTANQVAMKEAQFAAEPSERHESDEEEDGE